MTRPLESKFTPTLDQNNGPHFCPNVIFNPSYACENTLPFSCRCKFNYIAVSPIPFLSIYSPKRIDRMLSQCPAVASVASQCNSGRSQQVGGESACTLSKAAFYDRRRATSLKIPAGAREVCGSGNIRRLSVHNSGNQSAAQHCCHTCSCCSLL